MAAISGMQSLAQASVIPGSQGKPTGPAITNPQQLAQASVIPGSQGPISQAVGSPIPNTAPNYGPAFQQALGAARGNIQQQLGAALGDIAKQQQAAGQALGQLPGGINQAYGQANTTLNSSLASMAAAQKQSGMTPLMPLTAMMQPEQAAIQGSHSAALANVPLLNVGIQAQANNERAQANLAAQDQQQQLNMQQAQLAAQQQQSQQSQAAQLAQQREQEMFTAGQNDKDRALSAQTTAQKNGLTDPKTGLPLGFSAADYSAAISSPHYARALDALKRSSKDTNKQAHIWSQLQAENNPALLAAIRQSLPGVDQLPAYEAPGSSTKKRAALQDYVTRGTRKYGAQPGDSFLGSIWHGITSPF
jgi:hypothetical protein